MNSGTHPPITGVLHARGAATVFRAALPILIAAAHCMGDEMDTYVKRQMQRQHVVGLSLAIVKDERVISTRTFGLANIELGVPVNRDTAFDIASIGKQFTATATMMLVEESKLGLEDKITHHLSDLPKAWSEVTIRHLLTHTSGIKTTPTSPTLRTL